MKINFLSKYVVTHLALTDRREKLGLIIKGRHPGFEVPNANH